MSFVNEKHCRIKRHIPCANSGWTFAKFLCHSILWFDAFYTPPQHEDQNGKKESQMNKS
jgi:hypothetical protein